MYTDKKVLIGFILGIALGCIFIGIVYDKMHRENEMLNESLLKQTQSTHMWMQRFEQVENERNILSDVIRCHADEHLEDSCDVIDMADDFLSDVGRTKYDLGNWSYCY